MKKGEIDLDLDLDLKTKETKKLKPRQNICSGQNDIIARYKLTNPGFETDINLWWKKLIRICNVYYVLKCFDLIPKICTDNYMYDTADKNEKLVTGHPQEILNVCNSITFFFLVEK